MKYIDFISAKKGGLEMRAGTNVLWSDTVEGVALAILIMVLKQPLWDRPRWISPHRKVLLPIWEQ